MWLIDHGAAFYFHHSWDNWKANAVSPFALIKDHVLLSKASKLEKVNTEFTSKLNDAILKEIVNQIPEDWLQWENGAISPEKIKEIYFQFLSIRLANANLFLNK